MANEVKDPTISFVRPDYNRLPQYTGVKPLDVLATELGYSVEELVKLDANENPYGPINEIKTSLENTSVLHIYPDPMQTKLRTCLCDFLNRYSKEVLSIKKENIVCGTGSDELLEVILKLVQPHEVINCQPTFGMYDFLALIAKAKVITIPRINEPFFDVDMGALQKVLSTDKRKVIYLASPNNPTGGIVSVSQVRELCEVSKKTTIVIDQAYAEFDFETSNKMIKLLDEYPNLIVMRTFSKWAGLAGARVGYIVAHKKLIEKVIAIKQPYNVTVPSELAAIAALNNAEKIFETQIKKLKEEKLRMILLLQEFAWLSPVPSKSNFVLFKVQNDVSAYKVYIELRKLGVLIRYYSKGILKDYIRISAGRPQDTDKLIIALRKLVKTRKVYKKENIRTKLSFDGIIFDMDGVLAEVSQSYRRAIQETCIYFKCNVSQQDITQEKVKGDANNDWVLTKKLIDKHLSSEEAPSLKEVTNKFQDLYLGGLRDLETLIPERSLLVELRKRAKLGFSIVTGRPRNECIHFLEVHNLTGLFTSIDGDVLCVCMNETAPKPSPDPVIKALSLMNASSNDSIVMLGDTPDDIIAAKKAGIFSFGVILPTESQECELVSKMKQVGATKIVPSGFVELLDYLPSNQADVSVCSYNTGPTLLVDTGEKIVAGRVATVTRTTKETDITCTVDLDGTGRHTIKTGLGFLDHMLSAFSKHSQVDISLTCKGDLWIDDHHTSEDVGITLGEALDEALGRRSGIKRWGYALCPLDESLASATVDISSRPFGDINLKFKRDRIGEISTEMIEHVLLSLAMSARLTLHVDVLKGTNDHHKAESAFKAFAVAFKMAISLDSRSGVPSTKNFLASKI